MPSNCERHGWDSESGQAEDNEKFPGFKVLILRLVLEESVALGRLDFFRPGAIESILACYLTLG